jgi:hypothetical protein
MIWMRKNRLNRKGGEILEYVLIVGLIVVAALAVIGSVRPSLMKKTPGYNSPATNSEQAKP